METIIRARGERGLNVLRDQAKAIADILELQKEFKKLNQLISDLLSTGENKNLTSAAAIARALGEPLDPDRINLFEALYEELAGKVFPNDPTETQAMLHIKPSVFSKDIFPTI
ncbi:MAG: hypothetical protein WDN75_19845 [Bacteroidota bacterium]